MPNEPAEPLEPGTKLPWKVTHFDTNGIEDLWVDSVESNLCVFGATRPVTKKEIQDAAYIVEACNNYLALQSKLSALEEPCVWTMYECEPVGGYYVGTCGFEFSEHEIRDWMKFCPFCGHPISEHREETDA